MNFIRSTDEKIFNIHHEVITTLFMEHKFRQNLKKIFEDILYLLCPCSIEPETRVRCF